jgi:ADP-ribose pyrophosphatase YjhB (NUDIX family)
MRPVNPAGTERIRYSVAMVIRDAGGRFLAIKRADDDESLPGAWGLPAASLRAGETDADAVTRAGREKLGVEVEVLSRIGTDRIDREPYVLQLSDYEVSVVGGEPAVPQPDRAVSQYVALRYAADLGLLVPAARRGSLCSRIFLDSEGHNWR